VSSDLEGVESALDRMVAGVLSGKRRAVAQAITRVENGGDEARAILSRLYCHTGNAHVIGVTGSPGTGKSTLVAALARHYRLQDVRVGIVAVDPSSPFSGGAILGDRIRMKELAGDAGVFIRSMATRGHLGGVAAATSDVVRVLDAAACQVIIVETVGVGQAEVDIARMAHTVVVVEAPGLGDDIQALKAGLMEVADIFVVNKSDLPGTDNVVSTLRSAIALAAGQMRYAGHHQPVFSDLPAPISLQTVHPIWSIPVMEAVALHDEGIDELLDVLQSHRDYLRESGTWFQRDRMRIETDLVSLIKQALFQHLLAGLPDGGWEELLERVVEREIDPLTAAQTVVDAVL